MPFNNCIKAPVLAGKSRKFTCAILLILSTTLGWAQNDSLSLDKQELMVGAKRFDQYLALLEGKKVGIVANHSSLVDNAHLVDTLLALGVDVRIVFAPEHGFRGKADAGASVKDSRDSKTGIPIRSLYGKSKKPSLRDLNGLDIVVFDIQDVGVRFYTYISTMHYVMEACADVGIPIIVLDRPNPNGFYVDGPVLELDQQSFVGMHPIPLVHGLTVAELAQMIAGEGWLQSIDSPTLITIKCQGYTHDMLYELPVPPSPNLPNMNAVYLYPSLGMFEGTVMSVARGTDFPFQAFGHPKLNKGTFYFTPEPSHGAQDPKYNNEKCRGYDLRSFGGKYIVEYKKVYLYWMMDAFQGYGQQNDFFLTNNFFNLLAGNQLLKQQLLLGTSEEKIRKSWEPALSEYKAMRKQYLLYPDFK